MIEPIKKAIQEANSGKKRLEGLVNSLSKSLENSKQRPEDVKYFQNLLNDALTGKEVNVEELNKRIKNITNAS